MEDSLPPGRYLTPFEIVSVFNTSYGEITPEQESAMRQTWKKYEPLMWKQQKIESIDHPKKCSESKCYCRTWQQEINDWCEWADKHYEEPTQKITSVVKNMTRAAFGLLAIIQ